MAISGLVTGIIGSICVGPVSLALILPGVHAFREAERQDQCLTMLKQTALAFHQFEVMNGSFPAASINAADGKPLLSWRVAILPYIGQEDLYKQFKRDEPWNSPINQALLERMPAVFRCPSDPAPNTTHYRRSSARARSSRAE